MFFEAGDKYELTFSFKQYEEKISLTEMGAVGSSNSAASRKKLTCKEIK